MEARVVTVSHTDVSYCRHAHSVAKLGLSGNPFDDNAAPLLAYIVPFGGKRSCKFDDLSGGELALANMALYFAIHR
jgi:hypothetical protein